MKRILPYAVAPVMLVAGYALAQYPIMDRIAGDVIQKYEMSTCEQLWQAKDRPKTPQQLEAIQLLRDDTQMRAMFINRIAGPVANKMFECGMLP